MIFNFCAFLKPSPRRRVERHTGGYMAKVALESLYLDEVVREK